MSNAQVRIGRDPQHPAPIESGALAGSGAIASRSSSSRSIGRQRSVLWMRALARLSNQPSSCSWKSSSLANARPGSKLVSVKPCSRSTTPLACGSRASQNCQPTRSWPQKRGERVGRAAAAGMQRALAVPDQRLAAAPRAGTDSGRSRQQVGHLLGEDQRASAGARLAQTRRPPPSRRGTDRGRPRSRRGRLPKIELADLARPVDGALERPRRRPKQRPHLAHVIIDDRLDAPIAQRLDQLADPLARQLRIVLQQAMDFFVPCECVGESVRGKSRPGWEPGGGSRGSCV